MPFVPEGPPPCARWQISSQGGQGSSWPSNGHELFYASLDRHAMVVGYTVERGTFVAGTPRSWSERKMAAVGGLCSLDVAPDGKRIVVLLDADEAKPETSLHVLLNVGDELRRRAAAGAKQ